MKHAKSDVMMRPMRMAGRVIHPSEHARLGPNRVERSSFPFTQSK